MSKSLFAVYLFRKCATVVRHSGLDESDKSAESENEGSTSDNPSDSNAGSGSKGSRFFFYVCHVCEVFFFFK